MGFWFIMKEVVLKINFKTLNLFKLTKLLFYMSYKNGSGKRIESRHYDELDRFNRMLHNPRSRLGKIVSAQSIRESSYNIGGAIIAAIVNTGNGVYIGNDSLVKKMLVS